MVGACASLKSIAETTIRLADLISGVAAGAAERREDAVLDARVDKLVSAIGELIQHTPASG